MKNILVIAAENSAENYAAQIIDTFKKNSDEDDSIRFFGLGGDKLIQCGMDVIIHNKELGVVGIIEVISSLYKLKQSMNKLFKAAVERKADAILLIDYPDFNLRIARKFKKAGFPVFYYISPTVWAWRYSRVNLIKKYVDHLFIIFPFEIPIYQKEKIPFTYTGHPLVPAIKTKRSKDQTRLDLSVTSEETVITLLPGSRKSEIHFLLPTMLAAIAQLHTEFKLRVFLLKAHSIDKEIIRSIITESQDQHPILKTHPVTIIDQSEGYDLINASDAVLTTCGTSNLEVAVLGIPFTAVYRVNRLSYLLGKRFVKIHLYSIVNILAGKEVIKEWIHHNFTVENVVAEMRRLITDTPAREAMILEFNRIREQLKQNLNPPEIIYNEISRQI